MKAIVKTQRTYGEVKLVDVAKPDVSYGEVLIKIKATAICGSDLHAYEYPKGYEWINVPVILGHEYSGVVEALGEGVTQFKIGDRVMAESNQYCGQCANCHLGKTNTCLNNKMTGLGIDGGMAEYISVPERIVHKIPENVSFEEAAVAQPCSVSFHGVFDNSKIRPGDVVVVFGPGIIGLMAAQGAKIMGARKVIVVGVNADEEIRLPLARKMGFDVINSEKQDLKQELAILANSLIDVAVECSGAVSAISQALDIVRKGGAVTILAVYPKPLEIFFTPLVRNEIQICVSYTSTWENYEQALKLIGSGHVNLKPLIAIYPFEEGIKAFEDGLAKAVFKPVLTL